MADLIAALDAAGWGWGALIVALVLISGIVSIVDAVTGGGRARSKAKEADAQARAQEAIRDRTRLERGL